jgi:hypothetical protein
LSDKSNNGCTAAEPVPTAAPQLIRATPAAPAEDPEGWADIAPNALKAAALAVKAMRPQWQLTLFSSAEKIALAQALRLLPNKHLPKDITDAMARYFAAAPTKDPNKWDYPPERLDYLKRFSEVTQKGLEWAGRHPVKATNSAPKKTTYYKPDTSPDTPEQAANRAQALATLRAAKQSIAYPSCSTTCATLPTCSNPI